MNAKQICKAAEILADARVSHRRIDALPEDCRPATVEHGYLIQDELISMLGTDVAGWKIGATTRAAQELVGSSGPISGRLLAPNVLASPAELGPKRFFAGELECEFAFALRRALPADAAPYHREQLLEAIEALHPALEIADSRYHDWHSVGAASVIADNSNESAIVLGAAVTDWRGADLSGHRVSLLAQGKEVAAGMGANVLGDPMLAMLWLVNHLADRGIGLLAGQVVTTGTCTTVRPADAGRSLRAEFGDLGAVEVVLN